MGNKVSESLSLHHRVARSLSKNFMFPYFDHELIEFSGKLPRDSRTGIENERRVFRKLFSKSLPEEILARKSSGTGIPEGWKDALIESNKKSVMDSEISGHFGRARLERIFQSKGKPAISLVILNSWIERFRNQRRRD